MSNVENKKNWDSFENLFRYRKWLNIRDAWAGFIPVIAPPGSVPEVTVSDFFDEAVPFGQCRPTQQKLSIAAYPRGGAPELVLREAIFWLHKSLHVLGASEIHIATGLPSWSLSSAYQSGFFAARSIMAFLGVCIGETQHSSYQTSFVIDLCRDMRGIRPQQLERDTAFEQDVAFRTLGALFDHRQTWVLFQRILRVTKCDGWTDGWAGYISNIEVGSITNQRHELHYSLTYWVEKDLHRITHLDQFSDFAPTGVGKNLFNESSANFTFRIASILSRMALFLFKDMCRVTNRLNDELALINDALSDEQHPLFSDELKAFAS